MHQKIRGEVIHGKKLGRTIGFPTANIALLTDAGIVEGTYCVNGLIHGKVYRGVATYRGEIELFEAHFFDFDQNIYGVEIEIIIYALIRENMSFSSLDEIKLQIKKDVAVAQKTEHNVLSFGTFDITHPGHEHYLNQAKMLGSRLITVVARDENREKITGSKPRNILDNRIKSLELLGIPDIIEPGTKDNPMMWLEKYDPKVICLGYDQNSFSTQLEEYIETSGKNIYITRIDAYHPEKYKSSKLKNI